MSWGPGSLDGSARLSPPLPGVPPPPHPGHPPLPQPQPPSRPPQGHAEFGCQAREAVVAVGVEGPMAPLPGPVGQPAASAGPPLQLPGAVPPLVEGLALGGAPRKGPPVGEGIIGSGPCCPTTPNTRGGGHGFREVQGGHKEKGRKIAFLGIDRDVARAGETAKETEMGID